MNFNRQAQADPIGANFGPTGGSGAIGILEGQIVIDAQINARESLCKQQTTATNTIYPSTDKRSFDIVKEEIVYVQKKKKSDELDQTGIAMVLSTMNNTGQEEMLYFPSDIAMQKEALLNKVQAVGIARSTVQTTNKMQSQNQGLSVQMRGKNFLFASKQFKVGEQTYITLEDPISVMNNKRTTSPFVPREKVTLTLAPYCPDTFSNRIHTHMRNYVMDQKKWEKVMNRDYASTDSWANFCENLKRHELMSFLLILDRLIRAKVLEVNFDTTSVDKSPFDLRTSHDRTIVPSARDLILSMAKAFGVLKEGSENDLTGVRVTDLHKLYYAELAQECMLTIHCAEEYAQFAYGWNSTNRGNDAVDSRSRKVMTNTSVGKMLMEQYTGVRNMYIAFADAVQRDNERKFGVVGSPAERGGTVQIII